MRDLTSICIDDFSNMMYNKHMQIDPTKEKPTTIKPT
jgi:hypothetical protein